MKVEITHSAAFSFIQALDSRHPWSLVTVPSDGEEASRIMFSLLIDGQPSPHTVCGRLDGTWSLYTEVEP